MGKYVIFLILYGVISQDLKSTMEILLLGMLEAKAVGQKKTNVNRLYTRITNTFNK